MPLYIEEIDIQKLGIKMGINNSSQLRNIFLYYYGSRYKHLIQIVPRQMIETENNVNNFIILILKKITRFLLHDANIFFEIKEKDTLFIDLIKMLLYIVPQQIFMLYTMSVV